MIWDLVRDVWQRMQAQPAPDRLVRAGELAALEMHRLWKLDIIDPPIGSTHARATPSLAEINRIIVRSGWGKPGEYKGNGPPQWCGMTAGDAWATAGLDEKWLRVWWASTDRLVAWASYKPFSEHKNVPRPPIGARVLVKLLPGKQPAVEPQRGDIVIVGTGSRPAGHHVTVNMGYSAEMRTFDTIAGNGGGVGPLGNSREGISRRSFRIDPSADKYRAMWLVRPGVGDLVAP